MCAQSLLLGGFARSLRRLPPGVRAISGAYATGHHQLAGLAVDAAGRGRVHACNRDGRVMGSAAFHSSPWRESSASMPVVESPSGRLRCVLMSAVSRKVHPVSRLLSYILVANRLPTHC